MKREYNEIPVKVESNKSQFRTKLPLANVDTVCVYYNGVRLTPYADYFVTKAGVIMLVGFPPSSYENILVDYDADIG